jgi:hypothetical protein
MLKVVFEHSKNFRFKFNQEKSNIMIFGGKDKTIAKICTRQKFSLGNDELKVVSKYKYLGIWIDRKFPGSHI